MSCGRRGIREKTPNDGEGRRNQVSFVREYLTQRQASEEQGSLQDSELRWGGGEEKTHTKCIPQTKHCEMIYYLI